MVQPAIENSEPVHVAIPIRNTNRAVGSVLSGETARRFGTTGLPPNTIRLFLKGTADQSLGAFLAPGITLRVEGNANDFLGKRYVRGQNNLDPAG